MKKTASEGGSKDAGGAQVGLKGDEQESRRDEQAERQRVRSRTTLGLPYPVLVEPVRQVDE